MFKTSTKKSTLFLLRWLLLICLASLSSQLSFGQEYSNGNEFALVAGGTPAPKGRFLYMCSIRQRGSRDHACGGMLIASKWVLTAAHCLDPADSRSTGRSPLIYCGIHSREDRDTSKTYGTTRCYLHHLWTGRAFDGNDIALCELDRASSLPIPDLATAGDAFGRFDRFSVLGWGRTATSALAEELQIGPDLKFVPDSMCNDIEGWKGRFKDSMICAGFDDPNTCQGDSGGPLLIPDEYKGSVELGNSSRDLIVGITSFGDPSCDEDIPGVYTRVSCYRTWINCIIKGTAKDCSVHVPCEEPPLGYSGTSRSPIFNKRAAIQTLIAAIEADDDASVERVIREGLNPNIEIDSLSATPLQFAARTDAVPGNRAFPHRVNCNTVYSAKVLLRLGAAVDKSHSSGSDVSLTLDTPLLTAAYHGSTGVAEILIENKANLNAKQSSSGNTPLHLAASRGHGQIASALLNAQASKRITNNKGETPYDVICTDLTWWGGCDSFTKLILQIMLRVD